MHRCSVGWLLVVASAGGQIPLFARRCNVVWAPDTSNVVNERASFLAGGVMVQGDAVFVEYYG